MKKEEKLMGKTGVMTKENPASWKARRHIDNHKHYNTLHDR